MHPWYYRGMAALAFLCSSVVCAGDAGASYSRLDKSYGELPLAFEPNLGQASDEAKFIASGRGYRIHLTPEATVITTRGTSGKPRSISMHLVGANSAAEFSAEKSLASRSHYFTGPTSIPVIDVPNFAAVRRDGIYPGVDVVYYGNQQRLEYDFIVNPGGNPNSIQMAFDGVDEFTLDEANGDLLLRHRDGHIVQHRPLVYQEVGGKRSTVDARYRLSGSTITVQVAAYDRDRPLVIDPVVAYGSGQGGSSESFGIAIDAAGDAYVAGYVIDSSSAFPLVSAYDTRIGRGEMDAFVQKFNPTGTALIYSTYVGGGTGWDQAAGIAVDSAGNAYVTGTTNGADFPVTTSPYQPAIAGGGSFVFKLAPQGNSLVYSTYVQSATAKGIAVDGNGNAYITGTAYGNFGTTTNAFQRTSRSSAGNPFVLKLNPAGSAALYSTYVGGSGVDESFGIALDGAGNAYIAGATTSADFPVVNAYQAGTTGGKDAFVAKISSDGSSLVYSTYLGGGLNDYATAIAVDQKGSAYVTGNTESFNFPTLNAFQLNKGGMNVQGTVDNAFVTKLSPGGNDLEYSSFLGGSGCAGGGGGCLFSPPIDIGKSIAVDAQGIAYVGGQTQSISFPRVDSVHGAVASNGDAAFVAKVSKTGGTLLYSVLLGGTEGIGNPTDWVTALAADNSGNVYGTGSITQFPKTAGPYQASPGSVVFKLSSGAVALNLTSSANPMVSGQNLTLTASAVGGAISGEVIFVDGAVELGRATLVNGTASLTRSLTAGIRAVTAIYRDAAKTIEIESPVLYQVTNPAAVCN